MKRVDLADRLARLIVTARAQRQPATIVYGLGRCDLATNRDDRDEDRDQFVCGFNPLGAADDAVLVGRISDAGGRVLGTLVNDACHPTTLAWQNTRISPDYVGAMRQVVEEATSAPCLFVQGASGDSGPRVGFVGEAEVADRNGRCSGYAVLSMLESLPAAGRSYACAGPVISGATLGVWEYVELEARRVAQSGVWRALQRNDEAAIYRLYLPICALVSLQMQAGLDAFLAIEKHVLQRRRLFTTDRRRRPYAWELDAETRQALDRLLEQLEAALSTNTNCPARPADLGLSQSDA